ncbi:MAG TPA: hypothetical protein VE954_04230 [Oligoflexus sp.]|uniref:hypothetical protein n=1 Tax=Oligoflexus sp. TaxID=1971216 RepID=UPI002D5858A9|nr:hypothetical protein [Oligoflexus sp.]HYX32296.1 hypothetical protein [Oligoflexus sp.]
MQSLLLVFATLSGGLSQESIREPERDDPWVHHRSRLHLASKSEDEVLGNSRVLWSYEASGFFQYDAAEDPDERAEARVENFLVRAYRDQWNARVGWQTVSWGETLGPSLIDVINPRDLRDPSYWLRGDQKLAVPLVLLGWSRDSTVIDAWASPMAPQSLLPKEWQNVAIENNDASRLTEFGVRGGDRVSGWDMKVYAMRHRARTPAMSLQMRTMEPFIDATFPMQSSLGFTVSQAWDNSVLRSEFLHSTSDDLPAHNLLDFARDQAVVGLDGTWGDHFFWGSELRYSHQKSQLDRDRDLGWIIAQGQWSLWNERLKPLVHLMQRVQHHDAYQRYEVTGHIKTAWEIGLAWEAFQSSPQGYFTRLRAYDRLGLTAHWRF